MGTDGGRRLFSRAGRRTNLWLLWLVIAAFVTGWVSFAAGRSAPAWIATTVHALLGLGVVLLAPWKSMIIRRSRLRLASVVLLVVVIGGLVGGFVQFFAGWGTLAGISPIQVHVGAALVTLPLLVWHVLRHSRLRPSLLWFRRSDLSRRVLLRGLGLAGVVGAGYLMLSVAARWTGGPGRAPAATGSRSVDPEAIPATIWLLDRVPSLDASYRTDVAGTLLTAADLAEGAEPVAARLDCTSGWYADATWTGRRLADLIPPETLAGASTIVVTSETGYRRRFPAEEAGGLWLVVSCQGRPLTAATGAPIRLVAPGRRGFWWVKWVARVELSAEPSWQQLPFPAQ